MPILNWLTRDEDIQATKSVPYRLLEEVPALSYGDKDTGNMLIQGDNLEALKSLLPFYAGQVKCIYIDPPYNTKSAFEHYDDNLEHSQWLAMMWPRLELLRELLAEDGSIWVSIDDNEAHYLKVIMDEVFGRKNYVGNVIWQKKYSKQNDSLGFSISHDHIHCYAHDIKKFTPNKLSRNEKQLKGYKNPDNDPRGVWQSVVYTCAKNNRERPNLYYPITHPFTGKEIWPRADRVWAYDDTSTERNITENRLWWGKKGELEKPRKKSFLSDVKQGVIPDTLWHREEVGDNQDAKREVREFNRSNVFATPKPERLIERILTISTSKSDIILDSFLGSATTSSVAHKMGRRHIGIEMGEHAVTHCQPRLQKVVDGEQGGISKAVHWQGGGGFRFYRLGAEAFDEQGRLCADIRFPVLAAHVWFGETHTPWNRSGDSPALGIHNKKAYALLFNGILGDKRPDGGNVLTTNTLHLIRADLHKINADFSDTIIVYGESSRLGAVRLKRENIIFKQTPYDVKAR